MGVERRERNGKVVYLGRPHVNGRRLRARMFERKRDADRYVRDQESRRHRHSTDIRVDDYIASFLEDHAVATRGPTRGQRKSQRTISTYRYALKRFAGEYGTRRLDDFDRPLARKIATAYPVSNMVVIRSLFGAAHNDGIVDTNPFADLRLAHSDGRAANDVMSEDDLRRLADAAPAALGSELGPIWRTGLLFAAYVGPRLESFCALEWRDVNLSGRTVDFRVVKFNRPYTAVLLPEVVDELRRFPRRTDLPNVFWSRGALAKGSAFTPGTRSATQPDTRA